MGWSPGTCVDGHFIMLVLQPETAVHYKWRAIYAICPLPPRAAAHFSGCCLGKVWMSAEPYGAAWLPRGLEERVGLAALPTWAWLVCGSQSGTAQAVTSSPGFRG